MKVIEGKIVVLGAQGVGKTSLVVRYIGKMFSHHISPTIGASFFTCKINLDSTKIKLQVWDTAGQERFRAMAPMYYRNANAALLVFDITQEQSFEAVKTWVKELQRNVPEPMVLSLVGNKTDLASQRLVSRDEAVQFAQTINATYFESSALQDQGIEEIFLSTAMQMVELSKQGGTTLKIYDSDAITSTPPTEEEYLLFLQLCLKNTVNSTITKMAPPRNEGVVEKSVSDGRSGRWRREMKEAGGGAKMAGGGPRRGDRYLPQFKERVVIFAKTHTFLETARKFNVHNTTVSDWVRDYDNKHKPTEEPQDAPELMDTAGRSADDKFREWLLACVADDDAVDSITRDSLVQKAEEAVSTTDTASDWFTTWLCRLKEQTKRERNCSHLQYPPWFKTAVRHHTERTNASQAASAFGLSRRTVCVWIKPKPDGQETKKKRGGEGRAVTDTNIDKQLVKWVHSTFGEGEIKKLEVRKKAQEMYSAAGYQIACSNGWYIRWCRRHMVNTKKKLALDSKVEHKLVHWILTETERWQPMSNVLLRDQAIKLGKLTTCNENFKVSSSWLFRFLHRYSSLLQPQRNLCENIYPEFMVDAVADFRRSLEKMFFIGCMDELPISFSYPMSGESDVDLSSYGINVKKLELLPKSTSKCTFALLVLSALEDGQVLPPCLLFPGPIDSYKDCTEVKSNLVHIKSQTTMVMETESFRQWIEEIWFSHITVPNALVVDCLDTHNDEFVITAMAKVSCHLAIMPNGCANILQPLQRGGFTDWFMVIPTKSFNLKVAQHFKEFACQGKGIPISYMATKQTDH
ncbi:Hypothetical predicted protein [Cloeon dipterum]|uniref:HTH CENPB-type domain-containing protein n=1 Tax=Cloeon dipterum TaxID=197152 RepID=A0A8S1C048_9INSE|nr:Hypothetical predicted protein [Cloeon dipterum]